MALKRYLLAQSAVIKTTNPKVARQSVAPISLVIAQNVSGNILVVQPLITPEVKDVELPSGQNPHYNVHRRAAFHSQVRKMITASPVTTTDYPSIVAPLGFRQKLLQVRTQNTDVFQLFARDFLLPLFGGDSQHLLHELTPSSGPDLVFINFGPSHGIVNDGGHNDLGHMKTTVASLKPPR